MTIPDEAVEAAAKAAHASRWPNAPWDALNDGARACARKNARLTLEAAAPFIRAQALEDAADHIMGPSDYLADRATCHNIANELRARAAEMRHP